MTDAKELRSVGTETEQNERVIKTSIEEFLDLTPVDMQMIELKVKLALKLKEACQQRKMTETQLGDHLDTDQ